MVITTDNSIDPFATILASPEQHQSYANHIADKYKGFMHQVGNISQSVANTIKDSLNYVNSSNFINAVRRVTRTIGTQVDDNLIHLVRPQNLNNLTTRTRATMMESKTPLRLYQKGIYDENVMQGYVDPFPAIKKLEDRPSYQAIVNGYSYYNGETSKRVIYNSSHSYDDYRLDEKLTTTLNWELVSELISDGIDVI